MYSIRVRAFELQGCRLPGFKVSIARFECSGFGASADLKPKALTSLGASSLWFDASGLGFGPGRATLRTNWLWT